MAHLIITAAAAAIIITLIATSDRPRVGRIFDRLADKVRG